MSEGENVTTGVSDKGKGKEYECEDYISGIGRVARENDLDYYVRQAHHGTLAIRTGKIQQVMLF